MHGIDPKDIPAVGSASETQPLLTLQLNLIGQIEAWGSDWKSVLPSGRKTRALLAILGLVFPQPISHAKLAELLWSHRQQGHARFSLRQEFHRLSEALQPAGRDILDVATDYVALRPERVRVNIEELQCATWTHTATLEPLKVQLLSEFDGLDPALDVWLASERERLTRRIHTATRNRIIH